MYKHQDYKQDIILLNVFVTSKFEISGGIIPYSCAEIATGLIKVQSQHDKNCTKSHPCKLGLKKIFKKIFSKI